MKIQAKLANNTILQKDGLNYLEVTIAPPALEQQERRPALIVFVLDRSGSMRAKEHQSRGTKISQAKAALLKFVGHLTARDKLGIVSFNEEVSLDQVITKVAPETISSITNQINSIRADGMTNISDALLTATNMITPDLIKNSGLIEIGNNLNGFHQAKGYDHTEIYLGDIASSKKVIVELRNNFETEPTIIDIEINYKNPDLESKTTRASIKLNVVKTQEEVWETSTDKKVITSVLSLLVNNAVLELSELFEATETNKRMAPYNS